MLTIESFMSIVSLCISVFGLGYTLGRKAKK